MRFLLIAVVVALVAPTRQAAPPTEVYLMALTGEDLRPNPKLAYEGQWINISNSPGYDNQPAFVPDSGAVLFSSNRDGKQTDIYRYDIVAQRVSQVTDTLESEYSPTITPDKNGFSVIRVEADGTQRLWQFNLDGTRPRLVLENIKPVGYHAWIDATHLALFILGSGNGAPATLQIADTKTGTAEVVATGIGRSLLMRPGKGTVSYMTTGDKRLVREFDPVKRQSRDLFPPLDGSQDAVWTTDGKQLWMAWGTEIRATSEERVADMLKSVEPRVPPNSNFWTFHIMDFKRHIADDRSPQVKSITRMAISPNGRWLAFVAEPDVK